MKSLIAGLVALLAGLFPGPASHTVVQSPTQVAAVASVTPVFPKVAVSFGNSDAATALAPKKVGSKQAAATEKASPLPTAAAPAGYVTQDALAAQLDELSNSFRQQFYGTLNSIPSNYAQGGIQSQIALAQKIDTLSNVTLSNTTVHGLSGLTAADIPSDIVAGNYLPLSGGTLTGNLTATSLTATNATTTNATFTNLFASSFAAASASVGSISATSTTATSTFVGGITGPNNFIVQSSSGRVGIGTSSPSETFALNGAAYLADITAPPATTNRLWSNSGTLYWNGSPLALGGSGVSLSAVNTWTALQKFFGSASSTLFSANQAYFGATATSTFDSAGFLTLPRGFISAASSTIGNGAQAGGLTISGGATTTGSLTIQGGGTVTALAPVIDASQTWNNAAVAFTGMKLNITNTAASSASTLVSLQKNGNDRLIVNQSGQLKMIGDSSAPDWGNGTAAAAKILFTGTSGGFGQPYSSIAWISPTDSFPYSVGSYFSNLGTFYTGRWMVISNKREDDGSIQTVSALADGSEPSMFSISPDVDGPAAAIESGNSSNHAAIAIYDLSASNGGGITGYSSGYHNKSWQIAGKGDMKWGANLSNTPLTNYEVGLDPVFKSSTQKGLRITANTMTPFLDLYETDTGSSNRNWRIATNYLGSDGLQFIAGASQGAEPSVVAATLSSSGQFIAKSQGTATTPGLGFFDGTYGMSAQTSGNLTFVVNGAQGPTFSSNIKVASASSIGWTAGASDAASDTRFLRSAAGKITLDDGSGGSGVAVINFGGTTSSFPAIKRNGAGLDFRLADDSGYATTTAQGGIFNGFVGIGTTTPARKLSVVGGMYLAGSLYASSTVQFSNFGAGTLQTDANGNVSVSSDERLKNIQGGFDRGLADVEKLSPILYKWKPETGFDASTTYAGFSAQNVQATIPEAVGQSKDGFLTLQDRPILAAIVNALKEIGSITGSFKAALVAWLGDATNGIAKLFADEVDTKKLCVSKSDGTPVCVTGDGLSALLAKADSSFAASSAAPDTTTPPTVTLMGNNPEHIEVNSDYIDVGALAKDAAGHDLSYRKFVNGILVSSIIIDTSAPAMDTIDYVATDTYGNTATSTRDIIIEAANSTAAAAL